jgi:hypothetical protein
MTNLAVFCHYSSDPFEAFAIKSIKNDSNKYLSVNRVSFLNIYFCWVLFCIVLNPKPIT